jgi:two-component system, OmpR family, sensor histidine kinase KdpD
VRRFPVRAALLWIAVLSVATGVMLDVRESLDKAHVAIVLLLVVLGGSSAGGRLVGLALATLSFLVFNWFFLPPFSTFIIANPLDLLVLVAFLVTGIVAAQLLYAAEQSTAGRRNEELKDALIAAVSHDLRTPLTTIKALAHDLGALGDERTEIIEQEADRLNRSVADLLDLSRLNAGAMPVRIELNAVDDLLGALLQRVEPALQSNRLRVTLPADDPLLLGNFDFVHTLRIVSNLVENAAKYSAVDAPIDVVPRREGAELVIDVCDRGPGISPDDTARIFDAFYRSPGAPSNTGGAGLGLSIAKRLAVAQNGALSYRPRAGGGSVFSLRLPAADVTLPG